MFKKNDLVPIKIDVIVRFFDIIAEQETFKANTSNQNWLWRKLQFIIDFFNHNNLEAISQEKLLELIHTENHKVFFTTDSHNVTKNNVFSLDESIKEEPFVKSLSNVLLSAWSVYFDNQYQKNKTDKFSKNHFFSIINICVVSSILMGIFYFWKSVGPISLVGISGFIIYKLIKKFFLKLQNHREHLTIQKEVEKTIDNTALSTKIIDDLGLEPWTNDKEVNDELRNLKNKTLHFLSMYNKREKNRHPTMVLDVERMWYQHIPLFIEMVAENPSQKEVVIKTIQSMENVLQNHIEDLFWDDGIEITAKQRYWLAKETGKNI